MKRRTKAIVEAERQAALGMEASIRHIGTAPAMSFPDIPEAPVKPTPPEDWRKGALLNVRNRGPEFVVTLYPEEYDMERPERALSFTNLTECQNFVSTWYARESADPRAMR